MKASACRACKGPRTVNTDAKKPKIARPRRAKRRPTDLASPPGRGAVACLRRVRCRVNTSVPPTPTAMPASQARPDHPGRYCETRLATSHTAPQSMKAGAASA